MLFLALFAAFFVGSAITGVFLDYEAEAKKDNNNENAGCEKSGNAKACENNLNTIQVTCESCAAEYEVQRIACEENLECLIEAS